MNPTLKNLTWGILTVIGIFVFIYTIGFLVELYLPYLLVSIYIGVVILGIKIWKSLDFKKESVPAVLFIAGLVWMTSSKLLMGMGSVGLPSYIENKYRAGEKYYITECRYSGPLYNIFRTPAHCTVPGIPGAEREANMIIKFNSIGTYIPFGLALIWYIWNKRVQKKNQVVAK